MLILLLKNKWNIKFIYTVRFILSVNYDETNTGKMTIRWKFWWENSVNLGKIFQNRQRVEFKKLLKIA